MSADAIFTPLSLSDNILSFYAAVIVKISTCIFDIVELTLELVRHSERNPTQLICYFVTLTLGPKIKAHQGVSCVSNLVT